MVEDNGQGFVLPDRLSRFAAEGHFGLLGLQERVELVEGKLNISSALDQGCRIRVDVPLQPDPDQEIRFEKSRQDVSRS